jgi:hypothetical protein
MENSKETNPIHAFKALDEKRDDIINLCDTSKLLRAIEMLDSIEGVMVMLCMKFKDDLKYGQDQFTYDGKRFFPDRNGEY